MIVGIRVPRRFRAAPERVVKMNGLKGSERGREPVDRLQVLSPEGRARFWTLFAQLLKA